ncbi:hypothetical protein OF83DRAFT_1199907 [Amylostereum chailletii]|nr:hypothetical protein OF83DRAFT_1199907 [Amylostereum chailletii]
MSSQVAPTVLQDKAEFIDKLFSLPTSTGVPGATFDSAKALVKNLKRNFIENHAYFNEDGFHNHVMDHLFALYSLGGTPAALDEVYAAHDYQMPAFASPEPITGVNFLEHLGDDKFYDAYMSYFCTHLLSHSVAETIQQFIFSPEYNFIPGLDAINAENVKQGKAGNKQQPEMLNRLLAGLVHPFIHLGYGVEFGVAQQVAEGLAQAAIHPAHQTEMIPLSFFDTSLTPNPFLRGLSETTQSNAPAAPKPSFNFHTTILTDPALSPSALDLSLGPRGYEGVVASGGPTILKHVNAWYDGWLAGVADEDLEPTLERMVEEVVFGNVLWYGVCGWALRGEKVLNADFTSMHFVTSAIFLPLFLLPGSRSSALSPALPLQSRFLLLRAYLATCAGWLVANGQPPLPIRDFYSATSHHLSAPPAPHAHKPANRVDGKRDLDAPGLTMRTGGSAWARIWTNVVVHPNEHLIKAIRALGAFSAVYGGIEKGYFVREGAGEGEGVDGIEELDGTMFTRVAGLTMDRLGWAYEEDPVGLWD